jgi:hypothetical protein
MNALKDDLRRSAICTAVFAAVFGFVVACSNGNPTILAQGTRGLIRLVSHITPVMIGLPSNLASSQPFMATLFQAQQQASQIQQSFQGGGVCGNGVSATGALVNPSGAKTGFIPLQVPIEPDIRTQNVSTPFLLACQGVFSQIGGGVDTVSGGTLTNPGTPVYLDGTLSTLIVTGISAKGSLIRCNDLITTYAVKDQQLVQPYLVIDNNSVILGIGTTQLPFTCNLSIPPGDQAAVLTVQWAKI